LSQNIFARIVDEENLEKAYRKSLKGGNKYNSESDGFFAERDLQPEKVKAKV